METKKDLTSNTETAMVSRAEYEAELEEKDKELEEKNKRIAELEAMLAQKE